MNQNGYLLSRSGKAPRQGPRDDVLSAGVLFSIIVPVKDGETTILRAVGSVLKQVYPLVEVVVVVNGTTDRTVELLESVTDRRLTVVQLAEGGRSRARNIGINVASGEYVVFLDADDELLPSRIENALARLRDGFDAVQGAAYYQSEAGARHIVPAYTGHDFITRLHVQNSIPINSMTLRREVCSTFPEESEYCEDWEFWLRTLPGLRIGTYDTPDCVVHMHGGNTSGDIVKMKSHELPIYIRHRPSALPVVWRFKRICLIAVAATFYASAEPISVVEEALAESWSVRSAVRVLRRSKPLRRTALRIVKKVFGLDVQASLYAD